MGHSDFRVSRETEVVHIFLACTQSYSHRKTINNCLYIIGNESGPACLGASIGKNVFSIYDPKHTPNLSSKII